MRAACVQLSVKPCDIYANKRHALELSSQAIDEGAELVVLPELFMSGFCYEVEPEDVPYPSLMPLRALSVESGAIVIGSIIASSDRGPFNMGFCLDGNSAGFYPKTHLFQDEKTHFRAGDVIAPIKTSRLRVGLEICYEIRFPEVARRLCIAGAELLVTIAQFPVERIYQWRSLVIARAIENQIHHIACNASGSAGGSSMIVDPKGEVLTEAGSDESVIIADLDLAERNRVRNTIKCWEDRRPDLYEESGTLAENAHSFIE